ncbi:flagellar hook-length control protein FliK [Vibrio alginolyticus]|uniref:flagellar hook-length control protein FliK n=1 Tax=Vibrio sp. B1FLJ16 TaxID=2751178 RepID=UPI0015F5B8CD|nr:flagellar hook-length control protein FliK [Vibrio sp. B1FLJ16]CAD7811832.1 Flagellar hook-length control protein FliK [Vibrio sp. B1FLJ16]CAE6917291.1 Flagellar hook-length control protein FliK [Vibrio sp. B1FLJ16]
MMAATTANALLTSSSGGSSAGDAITSNSQGSGTEAFGQSLAKAESNASAQEGRLAALANGQDLTTLVSGDLDNLVSDELVSDEGSVPQTGPLTLLNEQGIPEAGVLPALQSIHSTQQNSRLNETNALKSQSAVTAIDLSEGKSQRAAATTVDVSGSKSQLAALNISLSQRESLSAATSELLSRSKVQVVQDSKLAAVNDAAQIRTTSQELTFKAELAMNSSNKAEVGQRLVSMLSDKITLQASSQANKATIRLDPPELGKIDLTVTLERDRLSVQINSTNASVREAITQTVERLRAELVQENFLEVTVNIGNDDKSDSSQHNHVQDDALTHVASNLSASEEQVDESSEQQQEIIARV